MTAKTYTPDIGHIIHLHFETAAGNAFPDKKPALILSPAAYNKRTGLVVSCAITPDVKGYPFEVLINDGNAAVLADQVKSLDWKNTKITHAGRIDPKALAEVRAKLHALIFM